MQQRKKKREDLRYEKHPRLPKPISVRVNNILKDQMIINQQIAQRKIPPHSAAGKTSNNNRYAHRQGDNRKKKYTTK